MKTLMNGSKNHLKTIRLFWVVLVFCFGVSGILKAQQPLENPLSEHASVSLLTASPGSEVWSQYGHTAIHICDPTNQIDLVFNYGLFDFNSPNFLWRFITGETDYIVGASSYMNFLLEYQIENRAVTEQVLNLQPKEKEVLWQSLVTNSLPENRTYRYNFFFNNCSTKPRDLIVKAISGNVDYCWEGKFKTLREEVHFFTNQYPWTQFGIDFALGAPADTTAHLKAQQFAPDLLKESFARAIITNDSAKSRPLVLLTLNPVKIDPSQNEETSTYPNPILVVWILFILVATSTYFEFKKGTQFHLVNALLFLIAGILGTIIAFMVLFSAHPTTNVNYLLLWIQPLHLIYAICLISPKFRRSIATKYLIINLPLQVFALAGTLFIPQYFHPAMYPLLLCLMLRSALALWIFTKTTTNAS